MAEPSTVDSGLGTEPDQPQGSGKPALLPKGWSDFERVTLGMLLLLAVFAMVIGGFVIALWVGRDSDNGGGGGGGGDGDPYVYNKDTSTLTTQLVAGSPTSPLITQVGGITTTSVCTGPQEVLRIPIPGETNQCRIVITADASASWVYEFTCTKSALVSAPDLLLAPAVSGLPLPVVTVVDEQIVVTVQSVPVVNWAATDTITSQ